MNFRIPFTLISMAIISAGLTGCVEEDIYMSSTQPVATSTTTSYYTNVGPNDAYYRSHGHHSRQVVRREVVTEQPVIVNSTTYEVSSRRSRSYQGPSVTQTPPAPPEFTHRRASGPTVTVTPPAPRESSAPVITQTAPAPREDSAPVVTQTPAAPAEQNASVTQTSTAPAEQTASVTETPAAPVEVASNDAVTQTAAAPSED